MFSFQVNIIKRRKISLIALFLGIIGAALVGYLLPPFLKDGVIPIIEQLIRQVGLTPYSIWVYGGVFLLLLLAIIPALKTVFQKKVVSGGYVAFDEHNLKIVKGKERFLIPQAQLQQINFEIKQDKGRKALSPGGSYMRIPTQKGDFICELDLKNPEQKRELMNMIEFLKVEHDVEVKVRDI